MTYQIVIPFIYEPYFSECISTIDRSHDQFILAIDNRERNRGVAASWNIGIETMRQRGADWLIILSATMRFGEPGMTDFIKAVFNTEADILACEPSHGWHLIAIRSSVFDRVGTFDENFYPIYFEDTDFSYRCEVAGDIKWDSVTGIDVTSMGNAHSGRLAGITSNGQRQVDFILKKWGGTRDHYIYKTPFNEPGRSIKDWRKGDIDKYCPLENYK